MISYYAKELNSDKPRAHPWSRAVNDSKHLYVDFKKEPEKIRTSLEDWIKFSDEQFAETFFQLLEWLNSSDSVLESNDSAFIPAFNNINKQFKFKKCCSGRLMVLFRDLQENTQQPSIDWLLNELMFTLAKTDKKFDSGAVGISIAKVVYMTLSDKPYAGAAGFQIQISMFAYGKNRSSAHKNITHVINNVQRALEAVNKKIISGEVDRIYG